MANVAISGLTASASNLASTDLFPVVQTAGVGPVKMTGLQIAGGLLGASALSGATVTTSQPLLNLAQTWNAGAVTFTGWKLNVTDTASASASLLMDLQVGGSSKFSVDKTGALTIAGPSSGSVKISSYDDGGASLLISAQGTSYLAYDYGYNALIGQSNTKFGWSSGAPTAGIDTFLRRGAAATLVLGSTDAAAPVAQTLGVQSVVAGTTNTAGVNFTIKGSAGTGTGAGGSIVFQVAPAGSTGTAQNAFVNALTIQSSNLVIASDWRISRQASFGGIVFNSNNTLDIGSAAAGINIGGRTVIVDEAANTLALRNGTSAQTFNIYNTYTDASNYERLAIFYNSNRLTFAHFYAGTGSTRSMDFLASDFNFRATTGSAAGGVYWSINGSGHFLAGTDNTYDIGASGANRPRNIEAGGTVRGTNIGVGAGGALYSSTSGSIAFPSDGVMTLKNVATTDFGRLQFGGTTSSFPALKRSSTTLQARLADDSAFAPIQGKLTTDTAYTAGSAGAATGYIVIYDSTGTAYKVEARV